MLEESGRELLTEDDFKGSCAAVYIEYIKFFAFATKIRLQIKRKIKMPLVQKSQWHFVDYGSCKLGITQYLLHHSLLLRWRL